MWISALFPLLYYWISMDFFNVILLFKIHGDFATLRFYHDTIFHDNHLEACPPVTLTLGRVLLDIFKLNVISIAISSFSWKESVYSVYSVWSIGNTKSKKKCHQARKDAYFCTHYIFIDVIDIVKLFILILFILIYQLY